VSARRRGAGDCFVVAGTIVSDFDRQPEDLRALVDALGGPGMLRLVHGVVTGTADGLKGVRFGHAWVEIADLVIDRSSGNDAVLPAGLYYAVGNAVPVARFDQRAAREQVLRRKHWGPWADLGVDR
jgi:hypothetical protein